MGIFRNTPVWELAKAVRDNDLDKIQRIVNDNDIDINYQEDKYGFTVLMCALCNENTSYHKIKLNTIKTLLELGADPNIYSDSTQRGENAIIIAANENFVSALRLLLDFGGDPNSQCRRIGTWKNDDTALMAAISTLQKKDDISCVELLVERGANINAVTETNRGGALSQCLIWNRYKPLLYLLRKGINYDLPVLSLRPHDGDAPLYVGILDALKEDVFELDTEEYQYKKEVIKYLKSKGLDYYSIPVPEYKKNFIIKCHPDDWQEFIKVY